MDFSQSKTKECLARAFAGICQDGARYQFISKSALSEGYFYIADQLKMIAKNKMAHASVLYNIMLEKNEENDNVTIEAGYPFESELLQTSLRSSSDIEKNEGKNIFPHFAKIAQDEGFDDIANALSLISEVNIRNAEKLSFLAEKFDDGTLYSDDKINTWTCSNCGHSEEKKEAWEKCPLCSYPQGYVIIPDE